MTEQDREQYAAEQEERGLFEMEREEWARIEDEADARFDAGRREALR